MAESRLRTSWAQSSGIMSILYNINRKPGSESIPMDYFSPYREKEKVIHDTKAAFQYMKAMVKGKKHGKS